MSTGRWPVRRTEATAVSRDCSAIRKVVEVACLVGQCSDGSSGEPALLYQAEERA